MSIQLLLVVLVTALLASCRTVDQNSDSKGIKGKKTQIFENKARILNDPSKEKVIISFAGKGTALAWDAGVLNVLHKRIKGIRDNNVVLTGSSSGAVWATYFACYGINEASIQRMNMLVKKFDKKLVNDGDGKTVPVLTGQEHKLVFPHSNLDEFIALGLNDMNCKPKLPTVIAAANAEVVSRQFRGKINGKLYNSPVGNKDLFRGADLGNNDVKSSFNYFLGKSCTYFVDETMFAALKKIPASERKCDLRLMEDAEDMKDAILASVSEPTYFDWWKDRDPSKILASVPDPKTNKSVEVMGVESRSYNGGYPMTVVVEDVKRAYPKSYSVSTGRFPLSAVQNELVEHWYTSDGNTGMYQGNWWLDADFVPSPEFWAASEKKEWSAEKEIQEGEKAALKMLEAPEDARPRKEWMRAPVNPMVKIDGKYTDMTLYRDRGIRVLLDK